MVVLPEHGLLAGDVGRGQQLEEHVAPRHRRVGQRRQVGLLQPRQPGRLLAIHLVERRLGEQANGHLCHKYFTVEDAGRAVAGDLADDGRLQVPLVEDGLDGLLAPGLDRHQHSLLGLGQHDLVGGHALLAAGHVAQVDPEAAAALRNHLHGRAGETGGAQVLHGDDMVRRRDLQTRLDEALLQERIADLDRGAQLALFLEGARGQPRRAVNAVAAGVGPHQHELRAGEGGRRGDEAVGVEQADAHGVDQRVLRVAVGEDDLAADVGDAQAVAVAGDAAHDALEQVPVPWLGQRAEAQRVHQRDGTGAHGEDVPDDAADASGRALVGLDGRRVVVRLDLHRDGQAATDVDDAGVLLAGRHQHARAGGGEAAQQGLGVLVAAVLAPQRAEHAQLDVVGLPSQPLDDDLVLGP